MTQTQPTKATLKGHGNPDRLMYFGGEKTPSAVGWVVSVEWVRGGANLVDESGTYTAGWAASATKFWAAPADNS